MRYDDVILLEYIRYLSKKAYEQAPDFDGYVRFDPAKCQKNNGLTQDQQGRAIRSLKSCGAVSYRVDGDTVYLKATSLSADKNEETDSWHKPRDEAERKFMKLARNPPTYQHGKTVCDYLEEADRNFKDPEWWSR